MEYDIRSFVDRLRLRMYYRFPVEKNETNVKKHKGRIKHIRDVAFKDNPIQYVGDNIIVFDIGNELAEKEYPYYHILEDAPVIRKKDRGTAKSRGSQDKITDKAKRDYGIVSFNGKTFSKEYTKNVRGKRSSVVDKATYFVQEGKKRKRENPNANAYRNIHYHYIENMLLQINPIIAEEFGLKYGRVGNTDLKTDYILGEVGIGDLDAEYITNAFDIGLL